jgi:hypothetical protein
MERRLQIALRPVFVALVCFATVTGHLISECCAQTSTTGADVEAAKAPSVEDLLLFFPSKYPEGNWTPKDLRFEDVAFSAEDNTRLHGWYCPCDHPRATILIAHGNAGHTASRAHWLRVLQGADHDDWLTEEYLVLLDEFIGGLASKKKPPSK